MKFSTKGRYGSRAMLDLALRYGQGPIMVREIAARQQLSEKYLEQILSDLRKAGFVLSVQGKNGGFQLAKPPVDITLLDVLNVLEGPLTPVKCADDETVCERSPHCVMKDVWEKLRKNTVDLLGKLTFEELIQKEKEKAGNAAVLDFSI